MKPLPTRTRAPLIISTALRAAPAWAGAPWTIDWWSIDGGSRLFISGGSWELSGSLGQWDATSAGASSGGQWELTGGFWSLPMDGEPESDRIFRDRFQ